MYLGCITNSFYFYYIKICILIFGWSKLANNNYYYYYILLLHNKIGKKCKSLVTKFPHSGL